jgi:hypothetical protein
VADVTLLKEQPPSGKRKDREKGGIEPMIAQILHVPAPLRCRFGPLVAFVNLV